MPTMELSFNPVPTPHNDLGVKGIGEGGTCAALGVIVSAVCDALGVSHIDMPMTPQAVWKALQQKETR
jgi:carbon-monoxide dehydrogenase large subunit